MAVFVAPQRGGSLSRFVDAASRVVVQLTPVLQARLVLAVAPEFDERVSQHVESWAKRPEYREDTQRPLLVTLRVLLRRVDSTV